MLCMCKQVGHALACTQADAPSGHVAHALDAHKHTAHTPHTHKPTRLLDMQLMLCIHACAASGQAVAWVSQVQERPSCVSTAQLAMPLLHVWPSCCRQWSIWLPSWVALTGSQRSGGSLHAGTQQEYPQCCCPDRIVCPLLAAVAPDHAAKNDPEAANGFALGEGKPGRLSVYLTCSVFRPHTPAWENIL